MLIEYHILQNFAPHCLNRDDTNAPKDCVFGGYRRARISSQCQKRSIRWHPAFQELLPGQTSLRTKRLAGEIADRVARRGRDRDTALDIASAVINAGLKIKTDQESRTPYLLFIGQPEIHDLSVSVNDYWDELSAALAARKKQTDAIKLPAELENTLRSVKQDVRSVDLALFGRMVADLPEMNIDAACQVAHALSTNEVAMEMDFYTAVDDLSPEEETGAGMMGVVEFNSSCFYRYAVLDHTSLNEGLKDEEQVRSGVLAFSRAMVEAIPSGKQNSMAAQNLPDYVRVIVRREGAPVSLANAFLRPIRPRGSDSLMEQSVDALEQYAQRLDGMHGFPAPALDFRASTVDGHSDGPLSELYRRLGEVA